MRHFTPLLFALVLGAAGAAAQVLPAEETIELPPGEGKFRLLPVDNEFDFPPDVAEARPDDRLDWWRDARFGLFIHWGLYAVPAGEWGNDTGHGEWIRTSARIPRAEYDELLGRFNPTRYDPDEWCRLAKAAGMKYIVITSKHHDGFALYDSAVSDYDVMATPYGRDILKQLQGACDRHGLRLCFYHSILDWHHPDYSPQISWEPDRNPRPNFGAYTEYLRAQVAELLTGYGPIGVMWFDGEWEGTWTTPMGNSLYELCRSLQPSVIVNDRVSKGRREHSGLISSGNAGDYATPEQNVPPSTPGERVDWETCMTMNDHWGWNKHDENWKSSQELIRTLVDIASKGGNYLLNVGPTEAGEFPPESVERLVEIGRWMEHHGESIYGTSASIVPAFGWGRSTVRREAENTVVYLHAFEPDASGKLRVDGVSGEVLNVELLGANRSRLSHKLEDGALVVDARGVDLAGPCPVVKVVFAGTPQVFEPPVIVAPHDEFIGSCSVMFAIRDRGVDIRYTLDGTTPSADSLSVENLLVVLDKSATVRARCFIGREAVSGIASRTLTKVEPIPPVEPVAPRAGLAVEVYRGEWDRIPDLSGLTPSERVTTPRLEIPPEYRVERVLLRFTGFINVQTTGMYKFSITSDDGSRLMIAGRTIDNDGAHVAESREGYIPLAEGLHPITVVWFNRTGDHALGVSWGREHHDLLAVPGSALRH